MAKIAGLTGLLAIAQPVHAQLLDELLPPAVPGFGEKFNVAAEHARQAPGATGWNFNGLTAAPGLVLNTGYDSAANAQGASLLLSANPSLLLSDPAAGFGAYAMLGGLAYPQNPAQNNSSAVLAGGERVQLPYGTLTVSAGYLRGAETSFSLDTQNLITPLGYNVQDYRASAALTDGLFTLTPDLTARLFTFPGLPSANRNDLGGTLTLGYASGSPVIYLLRLGDTDSETRLTALSANNTQILAGLQAQQTGLWTLSLLAGAAQRRPRSGATLIAPVLEARLDWRPTGLDQLSLSLRREIDDPEQISVSPYTLTAGKLTWRHDVLENITLSALAEIDHAAYIKQSLSEVLVTGGLDMQWRLAPQLAVNGTYRFNSRQADHLQAANEQIVTAGLTWTP